MNRRSFLKACGVGCVAPSLVALGGTTAVPGAAQTCGCSHTPKCETLMDLVKRKRAEDIARMNKEFNKRFWKATTNEELELKGLGSFMNFTPYNGKTIKVYYDERLPT